MSRLQAEPHIALAFAAVILGAACDRPDVAAATVTARDSAGVRIVHSAAASDGHPVPAHERLRIGVIEGDPAYQFNGIRSIAVDLWDTIYVAEQGSEGGPLSVRVFDPRGRLARQFVRRGRGPGELEQIGRVWLFGDTVAVSGSSGRTLTLLFTRSGELIRAMPDAVTPFRGVIRVARFSTGWLGHISRREIPDPRTVGSFIADTTEFVIIDSANNPIGSPPHRLVRRRYVQPFASEDPRRGMEVTARFLEVSRAREAVGALEGQVGDRGGITLGFEPAMPAAFDDRGWLYLARQEYTIDVFDVTGRLVRRISREHEPVAITERDIDSLRMAVRRRFTRSGPARERGERQLEAFDTEVAGRVYQRFPAIGAMLVTADGSVWARRADVPSELPRARTTETQLTLPNAQASSHWDRFDGEGRFLGAALLPPRFAPAVLVDDSTVVGVLRDELGVEYIVRYEVTGS